MNDDGKENFECKIGKTTNPCPNLSKDAVTGRANADQKL